MRPLTLDGMRAIKAPGDIGPAPELRWIPLDLLVVDAAYQREVTKQGLRNIERIAESFDWTCFAPVIVAPAPGGRFAIVDGQHRSTAAKAVGCESVPCQIIRASTKAQARAFKAVNGNVTRIHGTALYRAAVAAGETWAVKIDEIAQEAGVTILAYPRPVLRMKRGETMAIASLRDLPERFSRATLVRSLRLIVGTRQGNAGLLNGAMIEGMVMALHVRRSLPDDVLADAFQSINLYAIEEAARREGRPKGTTLAMIIARLISDRLKRVLDRGDVAA